MIGFFIFSGTLNLCPEWLNSLSLFICDANTNLVIDGDLNYKVITHVEVMENIVTFRVFFHECRGARR